MSITTMRRFVLVTLALGLTTAAAPAISQARGARPDPTFGSGRGWVTTRLPGTGSIAYGATVTQGGKIVIAGQATTSTGDGQIVVVRYQRDGRLDRSFGSRGIFKTALPAADGPFIATSIAPERSTGRLLIAGGYGQGSMLLMRLTPSGRLDRAFGPNRSGLAIAPAGGIAQSLVIQRNGGILLGGSNANQNGRPMVVARFTRAGVLDRRFGQGGLAQAMFWNPDLAASAGVSGLANAPDGGAIASGHLDYIGSDGHGSAGVFRFAANGRPVRAFGSAGHVEIPFIKPGGGFEQWFPCAMTVDSRGRAIVTGDGSAGAAPALLSARVTARGILDRTYGSSGRAITRGLHSDSDTTCGATTTGAGELTVGVGSTVAQLLPSGKPNLRFARGGVIRIIKPPHVSINAVVRFGSGRIVLAGFGGDAVYVARYLLATR